MIQLSLETQLQKIVEVSKKFGVKKVILFGSCLEDAGNAHDIDIAVSGIKDEDFFKYYGYLSMALKDEVDVVDLNDISAHFYKRIVSKGRVLYE